MARVLLSRWSLLCREPSKINRGSIKCSLIWTQRVLSTEAQSPQPKYGTPREPAAATGSDRVNVDLKPKRERAPADEWTMIYKFPYIIPAKLICRAKLYQTGITLIVTPLSVGCYMLDTAPLESVMYAVAVSAFACSMLYIFGSFFKRLVGIAYVNQNATKLKLAHLSFWGKRQEIVIDIEDIIPLPDTNKKIDDFYCKVCRLSDKDDVYFMSLKFGGIFEKELFQHAFGTLGC